MHTSNYITSLFKSFPLLPMARQVKSNVLYLTFRHGQDLVLHHLYLLLWSFKLQLSFGLTLWLCHCWALTPSSSIFPHSADEAPQRPFRVWKATSCGRVRLRQRFQRGWRFSNLAKWWQRQWSQRQKARGETVWEVVVTLGMESGWEGRTKDKSSISSWEIK